MIFHGGHDRVEHYSVLASRCVYEEGIVILVPHLEQVLDLRKGIHWSGGKAVVD